MTTEIFEFSKNLNDITKTTVVKEIACQQRIT
jgi:hypothetical protein